MRFPSLQHWVQADLLGTAIPRLAAPLLPGIVTRGPAQTEAGADAVYLTFDDGPDPEGTSALLDRLAAHDATALFFLLGERAERHPGPTRQIVDAGHQVGVHGWDHTSLWRDPSAMAGFERATALLEDQGGQPIRAVRPPYGRFTPALTRWCAETDRRLVLWDVMPGDFVPSPASVAARIDAVASRLTRMVRPGSVVVLHEGGAARDVVPAVLDQTLPVLRSDGVTPAALVLP